MPERQMDFAAPPAVLAVLEAGCYAMGAVRMSHSLQLRAGAEVTG